MRMVMPAAQRPSYLPSLTGLRGAGALWVVAFHAMNALAPTGTMIDRGIRLFSTDGWMGVDLFFLLSGFMLMHSHAGEFTTLQCKAVMRFFRARALRVYPLSLGALLLVVLLVSFDSTFAGSVRDLDKDNLSATSFLLTATLAIGWIPHSGEWNQSVWSLSVEILGYAAFPFVACAVLRIRRPAVAMGLAIVLILNVIAYQYGKGLLGYNDISMSGALARLSGYFLAGIMIRHSVALAPLKRPAGNAVTALAALAIVLLVIGPWGALLPVAFATLIYGLSSADGRLARLLSTRAALFFGAISFPLYLLHMMPLWCFGFHAGRLKPAPIVLYAALGALLGSLILLSWLLHRFVEKPSHRLAQRLSLRRKTGMSAVAAGQDAWWRRGQERALL